ncbi:MAG: hypothetical protein JRJ44_08700 [Deltaproteobacteria bacterium]|nr:hypothetical protein [Deltaproteobacteria bacterium]
MIELADNTVNLIVTSPPYFNAPFDYKGLFESYGQYLGVLKKMAILKLKNQTIFLKCLKEKQVDINL